MVSNLVQDGGAHFSDQIILVIAGNFDVFLEDENPVWHWGRFGDRAIGQWASHIQSQEEFVLVKAAFAELFACWACADFDGDFLEVRRERFGDIGQCLFHQLGESLFADMVGHVRYPLRRQEIIAGMGQEGTLGHEVHMSETRRIGGRAGLWRFVVSMVVGMVVGGCGAPSFLVTPVSSSTKLREEIVAEGRGWCPDKVVIIEVEGMIVNARSGGFLQARENKVSLFAQQMKKAEEDPRVKAVVLRINSPGGTVAATEAMYETVLRFREKTRKPVVAASQEVAASGGYYLACAADQVVVQPTSIVGSIGVIFQTFDISGTLGKIGARTEAIKSGQMKDMGSPLKTMTAEERAVMQGIVDQFYGRFKGVVKRGRGLDDARVASVSDGRVFTGEQAVELGLADKMAMLPEAIEIAKELGKSPEAAVVLYRRPYGYGGSIYARDGGEPPEANVIQLNLEPSRAMLPTGFYYLWDP